MNTIEIDGVKHTAPDKWADMETMHLLQWVVILRKDIKLTDAFALVTICFYKINPKIYFKMEAAHHVQLKDTLSFLAEKNELIKWLIKFVKPLPWLRYYGPSDRLSTSTIQEFRFTELYYLAYQQNRDERYLDQLIATLYRLKGESNLKLDHRRQLSQLLINDNAGKMKRLKTATREAILFNYEGCRNYIFKRYPSIFKQSKSDKKSNQLPDLEGIIKTVAGGKFGTYLQTEDTGLYTFLDHLADAIAEAEKNKK